MKYLLLACVLLQFSFAVAQENSEVVYFETKSKKNLYYVEINQAEARVFSMGTYLDKAGSGYSIRYIDTISRQSGQANLSYVGENISVFQQDNSHYLVVHNKKIELESAADPAKLNENLNNAYYLDQFIKLSEEVNKRYPLNHFSFRNAFSSWKKMDNKEMKHDEFRTYADGKLKEKRDSIVRRNDEYVSTTNTFLQNIKTIDYDSLKTGLAKLRSEYDSSSRYFATIVNEVAKQRPEDFFRLAEELPKEKDIIFHAVENDKKVVAGLKSVKGHEVTKREFFKARKFDRLMPVRIIGTAIMVAGIVLLLI